MHKTKYRNESYMLPVLVKNGVIHSFIKKSEKSHLIPSTCMSANIFAFLHFNFQIAYYQFQGKYINFVTVIICSVYLIIFSHDFFMSSYTLISLNVTHNQLGIK